MSLNNELISCIISGVITLVISFPVFFLLIDFITPTQEQIDFCSQPNVVCDSSTPVFIILTIVGLLGLYFILAFGLERLFLTQQSHDSVKESK